NLFIREHATSLGKRHHHHARLSVLYNLYKLLNASQNTAIQYFISAYKVFSNKTLHFESMTAPISQLLSYIASYIIHSNDYYLFFANTYCPIIEESKTDNYWYKNYER